MSTCHNDTECPGAFVCYTGTNAFNASGAEQDGIPNGCWCSTWYGNSGPNCTEWATPTGQYWVTVCGLNAFFAFILLILTFFDIFRLCRTWVNVKFDSLTLCLCQIFVSSLFLFIDEVMFALQPTMPMNWILYNGDKSSFLYIVSYVFVSFGGAFASLACISIATKWLEVGMASRVHHREQNLRLMERVKIGLFGLQIVLLVSFVVTIVTGHSNRVGIVAIFFEFLIITAFIIGFRSLQRTVIAAVNFIQSTPHDQVSSDTTVLIEALRDVWITIRPVIVIQIIGLLFTLTNGILLSGSWRDVCSPPGGPVPLIIGFTRCISSCIIVLDYCLFAHTHRSLINRVRRDSRIKSQAFSTPLHTLESLTIVDDGQADDKMEGEIVSVLQHDVMAISMSDAMISSLPRCIPFSLTRPISRYIVGIAISCLTTSLMVVALLFPTIIALSIAYFIAMVTAALYITLTGLSKKVSLVLLKSDFLVLRLVALIVGVGFFCNCLGNDLRVLVPVGLFMMQSVAFATDALLVPRLRSILVMCALSNTLAACILVLSDLAPDMRNTILPIGQGYSTLQSTRDFLLAQTILLIVEAVFVFRGRNLKRFLHVCTPVKRVLIDCQTIISMQGDVRQRRVKGATVGGDASSIQVQSGFMMRQASLQLSSMALPVPNDEDGHPTPPHPHPPPKSPTRVYVNKIAVKQTSALLWSLFDRDYAQWIFDALESPAAMVAFFVSTVLPFVAAVVIPLVPTETSTPLLLSCIPCIIYVMIRQTAMLSTKMVKLLAQRVSFVPQVGLALAWLCMVCIVFTGDARCAVVIWSSITHILCDVLGDADTSWLSRFTWMRRVAAPTILVLSTYLTFDSLSNVAHVAWSFDGGSTIGQADFSPKVIDAGQLCGDLGMFSLAIPSIYMVFRGHSGYFESFNAPVSPQFVDEDGGKAVMVGGQSQQNGPQAAEKELVEFIEKLGGGGGHVVVEGDNVN